MDLVTLSQIANPILQTIFIAVIGAGYYFTVRATWATAPCSSSGRSSCWTLGGGSSPGTC